MSGFEIPEDTAPVVVDVAELMSAPDGMVQRGDEFIDPSEYICCRECRAECRRTSETCFDCGARLVE